MFFYFWRLLLSIKHLVFLVTRKFRKALCCFRSKKEINEDDVIFEVKIVSTNQHQNAEKLSENNFIQQNYSPQTSHWNEEDWKDWNSVNQEEEKEEAEEEVDYFADMEPNVTIKKVLVKTKDESRHKSDILQVDDIAQLATSAELSTWDESGNIGGWLEEDLSIDDINEDQIIREAREQRRSERRLRSQNKTEKNSKRKLASKLN